MMSHNVDQALVEFRRLTQGASLDVKNAVEAFIKAAFMFAEAVDKNNERLSMESLEQLRVATNLISHVARGDKIESKDRAKFANEIRQTVDALDTVVTKIADKNQNLIAQATQKLKHELGQDRQGVTAQKQGNESQVRKGPRT